MVGIVTSVPKRASSLKVQCKEVKITTSLLSVVLLLIERHVSAYWEAIIRFNNCQLCVTNIFYGSELLDVEISSSNSSIPWNILV